MTSPFTLPSSLVDDARKEREDTALSSWATPIDSLVSDGMSAIKHVAGGVTEHLSPFAQALSEGGLTVPTMDDLTPDWIKQTQQRAQQAISTALTPPAATTSASGVPSARSASGTPQAMPTGATVTTDDGSLEGWARSEARRLRIDPNKAVEVGNTEGGFNDPTRQNMEGAPAFGPYQMYIGGPSNPGLGDEMLQRGIDPRDPKNARAAITHALEHAATHGWGAFQGAAAHGIGNWDGIGVDTPTSTPAQAEQTPAAQAQAPGSYTQQGLADAGDPDAWAKCGPVAAFQFAQKMGRNPTPAEVERLARDAGWTGARGMAGFASEAAVLRGMNIPAREEAGVDWNKVITDVSRGNPVLLQLPGHEGHYVTAQGYDPQTGKIDFGSTVGDLRAAGHKTQFTPSEFEGLGWGTPTASLYVDNPATPAPSVAAASPNAPTTAGQPPPFSGTSAGSAAPLPADASPLDAARASNQGGAGLAMRGRIGDRPGNPPPDDGGFSFNDPPYPYAPPVQVAPDGSQTLPDLHTLPAYSDPAYPGYRTPFDVPPDAIYRQPLSQHPDLPETPSDQPDAPLPTDTFAPGDGGAAPTPDPQYGPDAPMGPDAPPEQPSSPFKPLYDAAGAIVGYVQGAADQIGANMAQNRQNVEVANQATGAPDANPITGAMGVVGRNAQGLANAASDPRNAVNALGEAAVAAGHAAYDASTAPPDLTTALPSLRGLKIVQDAVAAFGDVVGRRVAESMGWTDDEWFSVFGHSVSGQDVGGMIGSTVLDPTNYIGGGEAKNVAGAIREAAPVAARRIGEAAQGAGRRIGEGLAANAERTAAADAAMTGEAAFGTFGVVPPGPPRRLRGQTPPSETRIPGAGYSNDLRPGAEQMIRSDVEQNVVAEPLRRADVAQRAQDVLGLDPETVRGWQNEALSRDEALPVVRSEALRQARVIDAEAADRSIERLQQARNRAQANGLAMSDVDKFDTADALLEAAETARAMQRSGAADTAESRAAARILGQRRSSILAGQAYETAARARQAAQDAALAAGEVQQAAQTGRITPRAETRLQIIRDKLQDAQRHGLGVDDGAGGRLTALEARAAEAKASATINPRPGVPLGTRIAGEVGSSIVGSIAGATTGAALPASTPEERRRNALIGAGVGLVGGPIVRRVAGRGRGGALAVFGHAPEAGVPNRAVAIGADPAKRYEFRYRVANLDDLVPSNLPNGAPNPAFPRELQPRSRERVASQLQIDQIAQGLEPDALLNDVGRLDSGPMIVGPDRIVESGNGRTLALQKAAQDYPERYQAYVDSLRGRMKDYGLTEADLQGVNRPVLVRERVSNVDRAAFAAEANNAGLLRMSSFEQAAQDAGNLSDDVVSALNVGENDTVASALRKTENRDLVRQWVGTLPANERGGVLDASGDLSAQGYERLSNAMLIRTYGEGAGERLARAFIESADPTVRNVQTALMASLPDMARSEALIRAGQRAPELSIAEDVATATEMLARLKRDGIKVDEYLSQAAMFNRELTPMQEEMLRFLDTNQRRPASIREALKDYSARVENSADPNQGGMFGGEVAPASREDMWRGATANAERENQARAEARRARANGAGLAQSGPESLAPASDIIPSTAGPEGRLAVEGAPAEPVAQPRPGPVPEGIAPRGGPEGALAQEGAPVRLTAPTEAERGTLPTGGPEGRLTRELTPGVDANLPAPGDFSTGGPAGELTLSSGRSIKDVVGQINDVLKNPKAAGAADRMTQLHADLQEISQQGFARSSEIKARLQRNGLLRAGMAAKGEDVTKLVSALARVDPSKPEEMKAVLSIISKPRLIDRILEYQYVNMLSSPITQLVNIVSNAAQVAGRLFLQNPLEWAFSGGTSTGTGAAFQGAARGWREGRAEAGQIWRTGTASADVERALALGDYSHVNRETLPAWMHQISTRPLAAMDALLGHMAYAGAAEQYAQRTADKLLQAKAPVVAGMSREGARAHVMANIWDYEDVIQKAGKIQDYTLLRSNDSTAKGFGQLEAGLRFLAQARNAPEDANFGRQFLAFMGNQAMPFFGVTLNAAKQGVERTAGVPVNAVRAVPHYLRGETERGAELAAKATIGAAGITAAGLLAMSDNLTGDGPSDAGKRRLWESDHRPNSYRIPGTKEWISWEGTPFAVPFGMVAGTKEGWSEAQDAATKKGSADTGPALAAAGIKAGQGAFQGFASQSFIRSLGDQYKLMSGQETGLSTVANSAAGSASRFIPVASLLNFFGRVSDDMERDAGKPQDAGDLPQNIGARIATRLPFARNQVDPRLDVYGEPTPNDQRGVAAILPYYRGAGPRSGDPITQNVEQSGTGAPMTPSSLSLEYKGKSYGNIPMTVPERHRYQQIVGQEYRRELEGAGAATARWTPDVYEKIRASAQIVAKNQMLAEIGGEEINRRMARAPQPVGAP